MTGLRGGRGGGIDAIVATSCIVITAIASRWDPGPRPGPISRVSITHRRTGRCADSLDLGSSRRSHEEVLRGPRPFSNAGGCRDAPDRSSPISPGLGRGGRRPRRPGGPGRTRRGRPGIAKKAGPNDTVRVAVIGVRGRGMEHLERLRRAEGRPDHDHLRRRPQRHRQGEGSRSASAVRRRAEVRPGPPPGARRQGRSTPSRSPRPTTGTPWPTIWACQAGKDVYVEKPVSHNVFEGRRMVEAARKYDRIVQAGTQCRSHQGHPGRDRVPPLGQARQGLHGQGPLLQAARVDRPQGRRPGARRASTTTSGSARPPMRPFNPNRFHYNWHWFWDYGNGDLGNQGIHQMDIARWGLGKTEFPKSVQAVGRPVRLHRRRRDPQHRSSSPSSTTTASSSSRSAACRPTTRPGVQDRQRLLRHRGRPGDHQLHRPGRPTSAPSWRRAPAATGGGDHFANFVKAVKPRDAKSLNGRHRGRPPLQRLCHLGNIAYRLGRKLQINPSTESFVNDSEADAHAHPRVSRPVRRPDAGLSVRSGSAGRGFSTSVWPDRHRLQIRPGR